MPDVTVVITLYNKERYIKEAIQSVLDQTYSDWELLILDDFSTDESLKRARSFTDPRIRIIALNKNIGQTHVLNYALTLIRTPYFIQLDADDWLDENAVITMLRTARQYPDAALIYANHTSYSLDEHGQIVKEEPIVLEQYMDKYDLILKMSYALVPRFYRTDVIRDIGGWMVQEKGDMLAEDVQITLRLAGEHRWVWVNDILYHRRRDPDNMRSFEKSRPIRQQYRYHLYNQILREWGDEYRAQWKLINKAYYLEKLVPCLDVSQEGEDSFAYTIVIPNYNHEDTIVKAIHSAINQSLSPACILIIDDASTDRSLAEIQHFKNNPKIKIISMDKNSGISHVLNTALRHITTTYFIQVDADDWMEPNAAELLIHAMRKEPTAAFAFGDHCLWEADSQGSLCCVSEHRQPVFKNKYDFLLNLGYMINPRCYRTDFVRRLNGWITNDPWGGRYYEDARMIIRLAGHYSWVHVPELLHNVRINRQKSQNKITFYNSLRQSFYEEMLIHWGDLYEPVWKTMPTGRIVLEQLQPKPGL